MLFFKNDYGQGCIPKILDLLQNTNENSHVGYGEDDKSTVCLLWQYFPSNKSVLKNG